MKWIPRTEGGYWMPEEDALQEAVNAGQEVPVLALLLMQRNAADSTFILNQLVESYRRDYEMAQAELDIIRNRLSQALSGPWIPTPKYLFGLLHPKQAEIDELYQSRLRRETPAD